MSRFDAFTPADPVVVDPRTIQWEAKAATYWVFVTLGSVEEVWEFDNAPLNRVRQWVSQQDASHGQQVRIALLAYREEVPGLIWLSEDPPDR